LCRSGGSRAVLALQSQQTGPRAGNSSATGRYLDTDHSRVVTNKKQPNNDTQRWRLIGFGGNTFKIQQLSSKRVLPKPHISAVHV
jgi:hypothetical protein